MTARIEQRGETLIVWNTNTARRGALTPDYYDAVKGACARAADPGVAALILASEGDFFCAGGDLNTLATRRDLPEIERRTKIETLHDVIRAIRACPVPVIAAVEGGAAGAGMAIALCCDIVLAARGATFTAAYVKAGLTPDGGLTATLARLLPRATTLPLLLHGDGIGAERLHHLGAISDLTEPGDTLQAALDHANRLADGARDTQRGIKRLARTAHTTDFDAQLDRERDAMARAQGGPDAAEGIAAFLEKRAPHFRRRPA